MLCPGLILRQEEQNFGLEGIGVLDFINQQEVEFALKIVPQFAVMLEAVAHQYQQVQKIETALLPFFCLIGAEIAVQPPGQTDRQIMQPGGSGLEMKGLELGKERPDFIERSGRLPVRPSPFSGLYGQTV